MRNCVKAFNVVATVLKHDLQASQVCTIEYVRVSNALSSFDEVCTKSTIFD